MLFTPLAAVIAQAIFVVLIGAAITDVPADAKTSFAKLAGFSDHQRVGIAGRS